MNNQSLHTPSPELLQRATSLARQLKYMGIAINTRERIIDIPYGHPLPAGASPLVDELVSAHNYRKQLAINMND